MCGDVATPVLFVCMDNGGIYRGLGTVGGYSGHR